MVNNFKFNISLSVLNHLGRNLYRNIITVIGEAISNSWDADANNVRINIDKKNKKMIIADDGEGMNDDDFQNKFLKIGYTKRKDGIYKSKKGRPFIGRKGIGKLALLSCANTIWILTKKQGEEIIGGGIDNKLLDKAISEDKSSEQYQLEKVPTEYHEHIENEHGTVIIFENIIPDIYNTIEYLQKALALYFRFSIVDKSFNIFLNDKKIDEGLLKDLFDETEFLWTINHSADPYIDKMSNEKTINIESNMNIRGFIASVTKPSKLKIRGANDKASIDLFVNGRLRERNVLKHIPSSRIVENYVYGQIFYDDLDTGDGKDYFTSSREEIVGNSKVYQELLSELETFFKQIMEEWDELRIEKGQDGDPDNPTISKTERKADELFNASYAEYRTNDGKVNKDIRLWEDKLRKEARFNIPSYTECFISENILREYIRVNNIELTKEAIRDSEKWKKREQNNKKRANISYSVRENESEEYYLDMTQLANLLDKHKTDQEASLGRSAITYKPMRDAVGHTSIITDNAKSMLTIVYSNIKARVSQLMDELKNRE